MNPTLNVNIGGYPFIIDDDAFKALKSYLDIIQHHFASSEGCEEIVHDIELRFAELLDERPNKRPIVGLRDVEQAIKILGTPEDFGAEEEQEERPKERVRYTYSTHTPKGKRLFRNPDEKVVGGVCSGLAAYFGMADPVWIRIIFLVLTFGFGVGIPLYIVLLIIVPKAKTPIDRLAMQGQPINVENIARQVEDSIDHLTDKLDEMSDKWSAKKKR